MIPREMDRGGQGMGQAARGRVIRKHLPWAGALRTVRVSPPPPTCLKRSKTASAC